MWMCCTYICLPEWVSTHTLVGCPQTYWTLRSEISSLYPAFTQSCNMIQLWRECTFSWDFLYSMTQLYGDWAISYLRLPTYVQSVGSVCLCLFFRSAFQWSCAGSDERRGLDHTFPGSTTARIFEDIYSIYCTKSSRAHHILNLCRIKMWLQMSMCDEFRYLYRIWFDITVLNRINDMPSVANKL